MLKDLTLGDTVVDMVLNKVRNKSRTMMWLVIWTARCLRECYLMLGCVCLDVQ